MNKNLQNENTKKFNYNKKDKELFNKHKNTKYKRHRKQQEVSLVCFDGFDINEYNTKRVPDFKFKESISYYFIHNFLDRRNQLVVENIVNKKDSNKSKMVKKYINLKQSISLNSTYMKSKVSNYNDYMNHLRFNINNKQNYVFNYDKYVKNVNSYQYSYSEKFPKLSFVTVKCNQVSKILYENTYKYQLERNKDFKISSSSLNEVSHLFDDYNVLTIDLDAVKKYLDNELDKYLEKKKKNYRYKATQNDLDYNKYLDDFLLANEINNGYYNFKRTITNSDGRLHSEFQRASKRIRKFCKLNNEPMYEADITAAVPTIFCHQLKEIAFTINQRVTRGETIEDTKYDWVSAREGQRTNLSLLPNHSMLPYLPPIGEFQLITNDNFVGKVLERNPEMISKNWYERFNNEIINFEKQLFAGILYENFKEAYFEIYSYKKTKIDVYKNNKNPKREKILFYDLLIESDENKIRKYLKGQFLAMLNAPRDCKKYNVMRKVFGKNYPCISLILETIKILDPINLHKVFSHLVLQIEGELILCTVTKEFKALHPNCKLITIHDCICTTKEYVDELKKFMQQRISKLLHINIKVSTKRITCESIS